MSSPISSTPPHFDFNPFWAQTATTCTWQGTCNVLTPCGARTQNGLAHRRTWLASSMRENGMRSRDVTHHLERDSFNVRQSNSRQSSFHSSVVWVDIGFSACNSVSRSGVASDVDCFDLTSFEQLRWPRCTCGIHGRNTGGENSRELSVSATNTSSAFSTELF